MPSKARWHQQPLLGASGQHQPLAPTALWSRSEQAPKNVGAGVEKEKMSKAERCCEKPLKAEIFFFFFFLSLTENTLLPLKFWVQLKIPLFSVQK